MKFLTDELKKRNAFLIDLNPRTWTVIIAHTIGFYTVVGTLSPYWLHSLLGYLHERTRE